MSTRIAFVGAGGVARRHAMVLRAFRDVTLTGVCDVRQEAAWAFAGELGTRSYPDVPALLDGARPDAVYVCVPPFAHGEPELAILARGVPLFVEKPIAVDLASAEELAGAVQRAGVPTATGYHWRHLDGVARAAALLEATPARMVLGTWLDKVPPVPWWVLRERSGGQVIEQTTHLLDLMVALVGDVAEVHGVGTAVARPAYPDADVDAVTAATLRFRDGAVGSLAATSLLHGLQRAVLELVCEGRRLELAATGLAVDDGDGVVVHPHDMADAHRRVDRGFIDAVRGRDDADVRAPYATALRSHRVGCALARSVRDGTPVALEDDA